MTAFEPGSTPAAAPDPEPRRSWLRALSLVLLGGLLFVIGLGWLGRQWLWLEIRSQAEARGIQLDGCEIGLGWQRLTLRKCQFASSREAASQGQRWAFGSARVNGRIDELEVSLSSLQPERVRVRGAEVGVRGDVPWQDLFRSIPSSEGSAPELPIDVQNASLSWITGDSPQPWLTLSALEYHSGTEQLSAELAAVGMLGHLALQQGNLSITLGDSERPKVRINLRAGADRDRAELSLDLQALPLLELEGPWLVLSDALRPVQVGGRIFVSLPLGLNAELPGGDVHVTLTGLQFPVPREVEGLVYGSPPKVSGKFSLTRSFDRVTFRDLQFQTGALAMQGDARLELAGEGATVQAHLTGPLSCVAIAESAARAHAGSLLAQWARSIARSTLRGSVQIVAALQAHTSDLPHARVLTSIGVGCGLQPLPLAADLPRDLLEQLPEDIRRRLPRLDTLPKLPRLPVPPGGIPGTLQLPPVPGWKPPVNRGREPNASG
ncbi:MAG: hypothetical protein ABI895_41095 [Deltaproteobacteria bacterium]